MHLCTEKIDSRYYLRRMSKIRRMVEENSLSIHTKRNKRKKKQVNQINFCTESHCKNWSIDWYIHYMRQFKIETWRNKYSIHRRSVDLKSNSELRLVILIKHILPEWTVKKGRILQWFATNFVIQRRKKEFLLDSRRNLEETREEVRRSTSGGGKKKKGSTGNRIFLGRRNPPQPNCHPQISFLAHSKDIDIS